MKNFSRSCLAVALASVWGMAHATPPSDSPYYTDVQTQYPKDKAQDTFQMASFLACFMNAMAPERSVNVGDYLAYIDQNKCEDNGGSANTSTASGGSSVTPPDYAKVLVSVREGSSGELSIEAKIKLTDEESGVKIPKQILAKGVVYAGPNVTPPYGNWRMDFCASTEGNAGTCDDGIGYIRTDGSGLSVYNSYGGGSNYRAGKSVFTVAGGTSGYGKVTVNEPRWSEYANKSFAFAPGLYALKDRITNNEACYNPSTRAPGVRFNSWDTFLYDQSTGQRVTYQNPGFQLKSALTGYTVGSVDYWGVNFWNEANAADKLTGAVFSRVGDESQTFSLRKTPGRLNRVTTTTSTGLSSIDGIPLNFGVWGWYTDTNNSNNNHGVSTKELLADVGVNLSSNSLSLLGYWSGSAGKFYITGYQDCSNNCTVTNLPTPATRTVAQLRAFGVENFNAWVNGINVNYTFNLRSWINDGNNSRWQNFDESTLSLIKQSSEIVAPNDSSIPALVCVGGTCPDIQNGQLVDKQPAHWPAVVGDIVNLAWDSTQGGPIVTVGGVSKLVDWRSSSNSNNGHYYQLYDQNNLPDMACGRWTNSGYTNDGYCPDQVRQLSSAVYYTWQSGNQWDAYNYLVYRTGGTVGTAVQTGKPLVLSYQVAQGQGTVPAYVGKTITLQSPRPGTLWLPGNCVDSSFKEVQCSKDTEWVNSVVIPYAADDTGSVTLLDGNGQPTSTKYYVKWLQRGVYFEPLSQGNCAGLSGTIGQAENLELPGMSGFNAEVKAIAWPSTGFDGIPRVIDGVLQ